MKKILFTLFCISIMFALGCERTVVDDSVPPVPEPEPEQTVTPVQDDDGDDEGSNLRMEVNCQCSDEYDPVCSLNNQLYFNKCEADCAGVEYKEGECNNYAEKQFYPCYKNSGECSAQYNPVCAKMQKKDDASDFIWRTFSNSCTACKAGGYNLEVKEFTRGECS